MAFLYQSDRILKNENIIYRWRLGACDHIDWKFGNGGPNLVPVTVVHTQESEIPT